MTSPYLDLPLRRLDEVLAAFCRRQEALAVHGFSIAALDRSILLIRAELRLRAEIPPDPAAPSPSPAPE
jgi:hypothetical protein